MVPTFDFSNLAILVALGHFLATIWRFLSAGINWITQRALAVFLGSKFWATVAFLATSLVVISFLDSVSLSLLTYLSTLAIDSFSSSSSSFSEVFGLINSVVPFEIVLRCISFAFSTLAGVYTTFAAYALFIKAFRMFGIVSSAWKT